MWISTESGSLVNLEAVRSIAIEVSGDRQFVELMVRWAHGGDRSPIASLIVQDYGDVRKASVAAQAGMDLIRHHLKTTGMLLDVSSVVATADTETAGAEDEPT
ncbi:MAG: hypothetical protein ACLQVD_00135 [Capsulimonadaceae bacterium]